MSQFFEYLRNLKTDIEPGLVFIAMPFTEAMRSRYQEILVPAIEATNMTPRRADDIYTTQSIMENVIELLLRAEVVLADVTDRNPNVLYELGMASAFGKRTVLISSSDQDIPIDLRSFVHVILDDLSISERVGAIQKAITEVRAEGLKGKVISQAQRLLLMCESAGIVDSDHASQDLLFRMMLSARRTICAVGLTGRSIFSTDIANLKELRNSLVNVETEVFLSHPDTDSAAYADHIEGTDTGAARMQIQLSTKRFQSLGLPIYWVRLPISIGGVLVDADDGGAQGMFQFFLPGQWSTPVLTIKKRPEGLFHSLKALFDTYKANSEEPQV